MNDKRETIAVLFERTAKLIGSRAEGDSASANAYAGGAMIAKLVAKVVRALGVGGAQNMINELVEGKDEGVITDDDTKADDASITSAVSDMYRGGDPIAPTEYDDSDPGDGGNYPVVVDDNKE